MSFKDVDPSLITTSGGIEYATFCIEYRYRGAKFDAEIKAASFDEAGERLAALVNDILSGQAALLLLTHRSDHNGTIH